MSNETYICYAKRTPIGRLSGAYANTPAWELGASLIADARTSLNLAADQLDEVILGQVLSAGCGQAPARQAVLKGGFANSLGASSVSKVCGSGLKAVMQAASAIEGKQAKAILAGGQENMSLAPHLLPKSRQGYRYGSFEVLDHMALDGLTDAYEHKPMGIFAENCAKKYAFSRKDQDEFAVESYRRASKAWESGHFAKEVVLGGVLSVDEELSRFDPTKVSSLRPAFDKAGTITAVSSSSISDGAALLLLSNKEQAKAMGWPIKARIIAQASFAGPPEWFTTAPIGCIQSLLAKSSLKVSDIDLFEINEAFAAVAMAAMHELGLDHAKVNPYGGACAIGHPIGASGARVLVSLLNGLVAADKRLGLAVLCIGGGEAVGVIIERL